MKAKKNKESITKFKMLWNNKQTRAIIKLGLYMLFVISLCILVIITNKYKVNNPPIENKKITFGEMQNNLINSDYEYNFEILLNKEKIIFEGKKENGVNTGYKKTSSELIEYYIDNTGIYSVNIDQKTLDESIFENIKYDYFDLQKLFKLLELVSPNIEYHEEIVTYVYNINTSDEVSTIKVDTNQIQIESIEIRTLNNEYFMNFDVKQK